MNYTELAQAIQDYTESQEPVFVANIPTFVKQAERRLYRAVALPELRKAVLGTISQNNRYLTRPDDFLAVISIATIDAQGNYSYLIDKDANFMQEAYPAGSATGVPRFYGQFIGDGPASTYGSFIIGPTPDTTYQVELQYFYDPPSIVDTGTSWLGTNEPDVLLYGCLIEAYTFLKGDADLLGVYTSRYEQALNGLGVIDYRSKRDSYRDGELRVKE